MMVLLLASFVSVLAVVMLLLVRPLRAEFPALEEAGGPIGLSAIKDLFLLEVLLLCEDFLLFLEDLLSLSGVIEAQWRLSLDSGL
jgi:hypothetical protein